MTGKTLAPRYQPGSQCPYLNRFPHRSTSMTPCSHIPSLTLSHATHANSPPSEAQGRIPAKQICSFHGAKSQTCHEFTKELYNFYNIRSTTSTFQAGRAWSASHNVLLLPRQGTLSFSAAEVVPASYEPPGRLGQNTWNKNKSVVVLRGLSMKQIVLTGP